VTTPWDHRRNAAHGHGQAPAAPVLGPPQGRTSALRACEVRRPGPPPDDPVAEFLPLVHRIARTVGGLLRPPLSFEDLVSAGVVGLIKAVRDYDACFGAGLKTYAYIRIKGAILDELRNASMLPAAVDRQLKAIQDLSRRITEKTGTHPTEEELADALGVSPSEINQHMDHAWTQRCISLSSPEGEGPSLDETLPSPHATRPDRQLVQTEMVEGLSEAIGRLDAKRRQIVVLYYREHMTMRRIAEILGITESRVSQLHASALYTLSDTLRAWEDEPLG